MNPRRYYTLDGMRGLAAVLVAAYHYNQRTPGFSFAGYLAVDLFFVISGFVLSYNYGNRLQSFQVKATFARRRLFRLYPMYAVGLSMGLAKQIYGLATGDPRTLSGALLLCSLTLNVVAFPSVCSSDLFPLNGPSWSLFLEIIINLVFGLWLYRQANLTLIGLASFSATYLLMTVSAPNFYNVGWSWSNLFGGLARATYSFSIGMLISRLDLSRRRVSRAAVVALLGVAVCILVPAPLALREVTQSLTVLILFPLAVAAATQFELPSSISGLAKFGGNISYPLYAIHWPLIPLAVPVLRRLAVPEDVQGLVYAALLIPPAYGLSRLDRWIRRSLERSVPNPGS